MNENTFNNKNIQQESVEKIFTQADVNRIISERLSRDKLKNSDELVKREEALVARELEFYAKQLLAEKGLPVELAEILKLEDENSVAVAVDTLAKLIGVKNKENNFRVMNEKKLPVGNYRDDDNYGQLRRAFGLV